LHGFSGWIVGWNPENGLRSLCEAGVVDDAIFKKFLELRQSSLGVSGCFKEAIGLNGPMGGYEVGNPLANSELILLFSSSILDPTSRKLARVSSCERVGVSRVFKITH